MQDTLRIMGAHRPFEPPPLLPSREKKQRSRPAHIRVRAGASMADDRTMFWHGLTRPLARPMSAGFRGLPTTATSPRPCPCACGQRQAGVFGSRRRSSLPDLTRFSSEKPDRKSGDRPPDAVISLVFFLVAEMVGQEDRQICADLNGRKRLNSVRPVCVKSHDAVLRPARVSPDVRAVASRGLTLKPETVAVTSTCTDPNRCRRAA